ncbi:hypothetical protein [Geomonas subterranea]|uniref:Lipoprotein n=1 Tax=Geomonas subterranea TaxID=2847989 RepID=A0ABX8LHD7_9BACT|nr:MULTISPECIES: hypothetical protein [Geomonas]QXE89633.1 hypothetical protein KP001_14445 [Geomonas subterranea]QXM08251.1 hypothetical protein KP002_14835 [Geomonas subterranea]
MKKIRISVGLLLLVTLLSGCCPCWWHDDGYGRGGRHYDDRGGYGERRY